MEKVIVEWKLVNPDATILVVKPKGSRSKDKTVEIPFSEDAYRALDEIAKETNRSIGEVIRHALVLERYVQETWRDNGSVIVERGNTRRELVPE